MMSIYVLSEEQLAANKEEFISLVRSINREGANIEGLLEELEKSDFYHAPASTKYHLCIPHGTLIHSNSVTKTAIKMKVHYTCFEEI